ncbi:MAG: class D sortase [Vicinamibacterales bacterium]
MSERLVRSMEWTLLMIGVVCLGTVGAHAFAAYRFDRAQTLRLERGEMASSDAMPGALVGLLSVPRLGLSTPIIEGDDAESLLYSADHLSDTPWPWQAGNSAIAAHRDGRFRALRRIKVGDEILVRTSRGDLSYVVRDLSIVAPDDLSVLAPHEPASLTLITCYPFSYIGHAPKRFIVRAERVTIFSASQSSDTTAASFRLTSLD